MTSTEVLTDLYASLHLLESRISRLEKSMELNTELNVKDITELIEDVVGDEVSRVLNTYTFNLLIKE